VNRPVVVSAWVESDQVVPDNPAWAQLTPYAFIYSAEIRPVDLPNAPAVPVDAPSVGRWIDVNLTQQVVVAYDGRALVRMARTSTGRAGFETTPGSYAIQRRVASETMTSARRCWQERADGVLQRAPCPLDAVLQQRW
jgi:hypothetical protein